MRHSSRCVSSTAEFSHMSQETLQNSLVWYIYMYLVEDEFFVALKGVLMRKHYAKGSENLYGGCVLEIFIEIYVFWVVQILLWSVKMGNLGACNLVPFLFNIGDQC